MKQRPADTLETDKETQTHRHIQRQKIGTYTFSNILNTHIHTCIAIYRYDLHIYLNKVGRFIGVCVSVLRRGSNRP